MSPAAGEEVAQALSRSHRLRMLLRQQLVDIPPPATAGTSAISRMRPASNSASKGRSRPFGAETPTRLAAQAPNKAPPAVHAATVPGTEDVRPDRVQPEVDAQRQPAEQPQVAAERQCMRQVALLEGARFVQPR